jgi:hypothetical protein
MKLAQWLANLPNVSEVKPCVVTIAGASYSAAHYRQNISISPGCPAYERGERWHEREAFYIVGMLPKAYCRSTKVAFTMPGDARDWYIGCYAGLLYQHHQRAQETNEYHPFGNSFILFPWDANEAIDHYEMKPYRRVAIDWRIA